jgi:hypothetical protein
MNDLISWVRLDFFNIPPDIFTSGKWEVEYYDHSRWNNWDEMQIDRLGVYRIRRPICANISHEEIMKPRYWKDDRGRWKRILAYHPECKFGKYVIDGDGRTANWFNNRESADIPPEVSE